MPTPSLPDALARLRAAIEHDFPGFCPAEVTVRSADGRKLRVPIPVAAPVPEVVEVAGRGFSPTEQAILAYLAGKGWQTGQQIADGCGVSRSSSFNSILSNLAETPAIESSQRHGYRLRMSDSDTSAL